MSGYLYDCCGSTKTEPYDKALYDKACEWIKK